MTAHLIQNDLSATPRRIARADGVWLEDTDGRRYVDGSSGAVVTAIGHANPHVLAAMAEQAAAVTFTHRGAFTSDAAESLAARLGDLCGYAGVWFVSSGSEAVEAAMQFALQYFRELGQTSRQWFLSPMHGYHGNTLGALSLSGHARRAAVGRLAHPFPALPTPYQYRDGRELSEGAYAEALLAEARRCFDEAGDHLAGVVVEPVGGATLGSTVPPDGYLQGLRELCDEHGTLLIFDEVLSGLGRTGTLLASEHWGVRADLVTLGKALGAGYTPIAATLVDERVLTAIRTGSGRILGGHTYGGNPLSVATASAVLDVLLADDLIPTAHQRSAQLRRLLEGLAARHPIIGDVRGLGMLQALEFVPERSGAGQPSRPGSLAARITAAILESGAVVYQTTGGYNDAVIVAPPLTITDDEIATLVASIERGIKAVERGRAGGPSASTRTRPPTRPPR